MMLLKDLKANFIDAAGDYLYLLDKSYSGKAALKIVGDRYGLSGPERHILLRGIDSRVQSVFREGKLIREISGRVLSVDFYNVVFTLENFLYGRPVFISSDGMLRDIGSVFSDKKDKKVFLQAVSLLLEGSGRLAGGLSEIVFYLDSPVSGSGDTAAGLNRSLSDRGINGRAETVKSPDFVLKNLQEGVIATSDSVIIQDSQVPVFDLARFVLQPLISAFYDLRDFRRFFDE